MRVVALVGPRGCALRPVFACQPCQFLHTSFEGGFATLLRASLKQAHSFLPPTTNPTTWSTWIMLEGMRVGWFVATACRHCPRSQSAVLGLNGKCGARRGTVESFTAWPLTSFSHTFASFSCYTSRSAHQPPTSRKA